MTNYREILRLQSLGCSQRSVAVSTKASCSTLKKAGELHISWQLDDGEMNRKGGRKGWVERIG